ncbi:PAS domain-containing protein [Rhodocytophaga rosea]|uniref:histidine kinase n=1 Tax=Rhodocytophaga rosea TaxID=2704465 RepID=A0A6C0GS15_9BACT|nr:PAS domain-containing protein [Rhodocytophaga rosea]QHT70727.1 PAS domain-containing protein [Rhodocytophaga rosea]
MPDTTHSNELLQGIFDSSLSSVFVLKALRDEHNNILDFTWVLFNKRALQLYPSAKGLIEVGKRVSELFPSAIGSENFKRWIHTTHTGEAYLTEYYHDQDGLTHWIRERGIKYEDGLIIASDNITEQKLKEDILHRSEALLLESQDIAQLGAFQWNEDMSEVYWTPQMFNLYGIEPNSLKITPQLIASFVHPEDKEKFVAMVSKIRNTQETYSIEYRVITADGRLKHLWTRGKIINGRRTGTVMDITERKLQEEKFKQSEELLLESQQIAQIGTFQMDEKGDIYWTAQMYQIFEIDPSVKITPALVDNMIHSADREKFFENVHKVLSSGESHTVEYKLCLPNGKLKYIWSRAKMVHGKFTGTAMDITERKELEEKNT